MTRRIHAVGLALVRSHESLRLQAGQGDHKARLRGIPNLLSIRVNASHYSPVRR